MYVCMWDSELLATNLRIFAVFCVYFPATKTATATEAERKEWWEKKKKIVYMYNFINAARKGSQCWWDSASANERRKYKLSTANAIKHLYVYRFVNARYNKITRTQREQDIVVVIDDVSNGNGGIQSRPTIYVCAWVESVVASLSHSHCFHYHRLFRCFVPFHFQHDIFHDGRYNQVFRCVKETM